MGRSEQLEKKTAGKGTANLDDFDALKNFVHEFDSLVSEFDTFSSQNGTTLHEPTYKTNESSDRATRSDRDTKKLP
jgi:hypothetical protein